MPQISTSTARRARSPIRFRYQAVLYGDGQVGEISESVGRRRLRRIDPASREGRRLLNQGAVQLWRDPLREAEQAPVQKVLDRLRDDVRQDCSRHPDDARWTDHCEQRLASIERWRALYEN